MPPGTTPQTPNSVIGSAMFNSAMDDIAAAMNVPWPVAIGIGVAGATGSWDSINAQGTDITAAASINLTTATGPNLNLTGNANVSTVTLAAGAVRFVTATGTGQLVASANLVVNGSTTTNYTLTGTELLIFVGRSGSVVKVWAIGAGSTFATNAQALTGTSTVLAVNPANLLATRQLLNKPFNLGLAASVGSNALTISLKGADGNDPSASNPVEIPFRNVTVTTGTPTVLSVTAATSVVVSSGSTLGTASGVATTLIVVGFNDAGTFRLGVINPLALPIKDGIASSTAEGGAGAADSAGVYYTGTAVTSKAVTVLGWLTISEATAGTWATAHTAIGVGNAPATAMQSQAGQLMAWVNFNGTGTPAIRGSGNVSSITDNGTGDYTVNFTTAMPDTNYAAVASVNNGLTNAIRTASIPAAAPTTAAVRLNTFSGAGALIDVDYVFVTVVR